MRKIAPSILSADFYRLGEHVEAALKAGADWIHFDVMDGNFVPPITYGSKIVGDIKNNNKDIFLDAHLMVSDPEKQIDQFILAGADLVNFHIEATHHADRLIEQIKAGNKKAGITLNPATPISAIEHCLHLVDLILVMSVNPGYGGQKFIEYSLQKVEKLAELKSENNFSYLIEIDGGVSMDNAEKVLDAGVDVIVTGSSFFGISDEDKKKFTELVHNFK